MIKKINNEISKNIFLIFNIFIFLQPILDVLTAVFNNYNMFSYILDIVKILFLAIMLFYLFIIKRCNIKYIILIFIYCIIYMIINFIMKNNIGTLFELKSLIKTIYFPIFLILF